MSQVIIVTSGPPWTFVSGPWAEGQQPALQAGQEYRAAPFAFPLRVFWDADAGGFRDLSPNAAQLIEVDLGPVPRRSGRFTFSLATTRGVGVYAVTMSQAPGPYTGKGTRADEAEMDQITAFASVTGPGVATAYWHSRTLVRGNFKFSYRLEK